MAAEGNSGHYTQFRPDPANTRGLLTRMKLLLGFRDGAQLYEIPSRILHPAATQALAEQLVFYFSSSPRSKHAGPVLRWWKVPYVQSSTVFVYTKNLARSISLAAFLWVLSHLLSAHNPFCSV